MRPNVNTTLAALALLASGSTPWACESRNVVDDNRSGIAAEVAQQLASGDADAASVLEPWYETCRDIGESPPEETSDDRDNQGILHDGDLGHESFVAGKSRATVHSSKQAGATANFVVPSTAAYGLVAVGHTRGKNCGSAKVYFDDRYIETINLRSSSPLLQCERIYVLMDHTAKEHRFEVKIEGKPSDLGDGYACLDYVVADWN